MELNLWMVWDNSQSLFCLFVLHTFLQFSQHHLLGGNGSSSGQEHQKSLLIFQEKQQFDEEMLLFVVWLWLISGGLTGLFWAHTTQLDWCFLEKWLCHDGSWTCLFLFCLYLSFRWRPLLPLSFLGARSPGSKTDKELLMLQTRVMPGPPSLHPPFSCTHMPCGDPTIWFESAQLNPGTSFNLGNWGPGRGLLHIQLQNGWEEDAGHRLMAAAVAVGAPLALRRLHFQLLLGEDGTSGFTVLSY